MLNVEVNLESLQAGLGGLEGGARDLSFATRGIAGVLADATERAFADEADPTTGVFPAHAGVVPRRRKRAASRASSSSLNAPATSATWAASRPWTPHSAWGSPSGPWDRRHPDLDRSTALNGPKTSRTSRPSWPSRPSSGFNLPNSQPIATCQRRFSEYSLLARIARSLSSFAIFMASQNGGKYRRRPQPGQRFQ